MSEVPELAQHFSITPEGLYLCRACNFTTKKSGDLNKHVKKSHLKIKDKSCELISELIIDQCEVKTGSSGSLRSHMQKAQQKKRGPVNECDFTANKVDGPTSKVKKGHLQKQNFKCDLCGCLTADKDDLKQHKKTMHDFKCERCNYKTASRSNIKRHFVAMHDSDQGHKCDQCEYRAAYGYGLTRHKNTMHDKIFDLNCNECDYGTNDARHLEEHVKGVHLQVYDYKCEQCKFETARKSSLKRHERKVHKNKNVKMNKEEEQLRTTIVGQF